MLKQDIRKAILVLHEKGHGVRAIARAVEVSRNTVKKVLGSKKAEVASIQRAEQGLEHLEQIRELHERCQGNRMRVAEELEAQGTRIAYSTLTAFCRRHEIGMKAKERAGQYHFEKGQEMQHDTSPHEVKIGQKKQHVQCASLVLCYSRMIYAQVYSVWNRFHCKIFLDEAIGYFGGSASRCMLDNNTIIIASGTGKNAVVAPEMEAFAQRYQTQFVAHELGDANRSARVEGPFNYIEKNFYAGRTFESLADLNGQLKQWCEKVNQSYSRKLRSKRVESFATEKPYLKPQPIYLPEIYELHHRIVDLMGYVNLHTNRYSVAATMISQKVEVRESKDHVRIFQGPREVCVHPRLEPKGYAQSVLAEHQHQGRIRHGDKKYCAQEQELCRAHPQFKELMSRWKQKRGTRPQVAIRQLYRMYLDYPDKALCAALDKALAYNLLDLRRIEKMILHEIAGDFFNQATDKGQG